MNAPERKILRRKSSKKLKHWDRESLIKRLKYLHKMVLTEDNTNQAMRYSYEILDIHYLISKHS